jgi:hypothetical protein
MKVRLSAWSERYKGATHYCVAVKNDAGLYKIFEGKARSNQQAYDIALKHAQEYIQEQNLELETAE